MQQQQQNATIMHDFELNRQTKSQKQQLQNPHQITLCSLKKAHGQLRHESRIPLMLENA